MEKLYLHSAIRMVSKGALVLKTNNTVEEEKVVYKNKLQKYS